MIAPSTCVKTGCGVYVRDGNYNLWGDLYYVGDCAVLKYRGCRQYLMHAPPDALVVSSTECLESEPVLGQGGALVFSRSAVDQYQLKRVEDEGGYTAFRARCGL